MARVEESTHQPGGEGSAGSVPAGSMWGHTQESFLPLLNKERTRPRGCAAMAEEDALRTGPVRLLGYANEVGESFRPLVSRAAVLSSYGVAGTYVIADAWWRARATGKMGEAVDTLIWQGLASVAIPGYFINRVVWAAGRISPPHLRATLPTALGLACIPFIVKPIDHGVDGFMNQCVRPLYNSEVRKQM